MILVFILMAIGLGFFIPSATYCVRKNYVACFICSIIAISVLSSTFLIAYISDDTPRYVKTETIPLNDFSLKYNGRMYRLDSTDYIIKIAIYRSNSPWYKIERERLDVVSIDRK